MAPHPFSTAVVRASWYQYCTDIKKCHGQSYDNASNMAGQYEGAQALLKCDCSVAHFVPCFGHSLNLASNESANCVPEATTFFYLLQNIYAFLSMSTHHWKTWSQSLLTPIVKSLSVKHDDLHALRLGYDKIFDVLVGITNNLDEIADT